MPPLWRISPRNPAPGHNAMANRKDIPAYTVRVSRRARYVRLVLSLTGGLQVVIPDGFDVGRVPEMVRDRLTWIERARERLRNRQAQSAHPGPGVARPNEIALPAVGEMWQVVYRPEATMAGVRLEETPGTLIVTGRVEDLELCRTMLKRWLARRARAFLIQQLAEIAHGTDLSFSRLSVRGQRSRWGSYSPRGTLSLNYKLLFLPPPLVRYVLVHELCHTRHPNHGAGFWALVAQYEPGYRRLRGELRRVDAQDIDWIEAERDYMRLHLGDRSWLIHETISSLEARLDPAQFQRIHRGAIVRRAAVARLTHDGQGNWSAELSNGTSVKIGRSYLAAAKSAILDGG